MEQEYLCDNAFIRHPARSHVFHPEMKSSFTFTFDIIYTIDLITLCSSPLLPWKASKSWRSLFYIFSHAPMTMLFSGLMTIPHPQTPACFSCSKAEDRLFSTQSPSLFTYFSLCEVSSLAVQLCLSPYSPADLPWSEPVARLAVVCLLLLGPTSPTLAWGISPIAM